MRTKRALDRAEVKTDNFLMRLAASPYTFGALVGVIVALLLVWIW